MVFWIEIKGGFFITNKIESIYKKMTGVDPRHGLQPPLIGAPLVKEIRRLRSGNPCQEITFFDRKDIVGYSILDSGAMPVKGGSEPYTLIGRKFGDGRMEATFLFGSSLNLEDIGELAPTLPNDEWAPYTEEDPKWISR